MRVGTFRDEELLTARHRGLLEPHEQPLRRYPFALRRFAQYAFIRFDMAFLAAALMPRRFCVDLG